MIYTFIHYTKFRHNFTKLSQYLLEKNYNSCYNNKNIKTCEVEKIMDIFKEQIVRKVSSKYDGIQKILMIIAGVALAMVCFLFTMGTQFILIGMLIAAGVLYGDYLLISNMEIEYEYIFTNNEMDIDKIVAQKNRKRLCTFMFNTATDFGMVDGGNTDGAVTYVKATADDPELTDYFIRVNHRSLGDTVITFTPNEEMIGLIKQTLPRELKKKL